MLDIYPNPLFLKIKNKLEVVVSFLIIWCCAVGEIYGASVSQLFSCFNVDIFSVTRYAVVSRLIFESSSENWSICSHLFVVFTGEARSPEPAFFSLNFYFILILSSIPYPQLSHRLWLYTGKSCLLLLFPLPVFSLFQHLFCFALRRGNKFLW